MRIKAPCPATRSRGNAGPANRAGTDLLYTSVACFVASTLISLIGAVLISTRASFPVSFILAVAFVAGTLGVIAMISGSALLARETTFSFRVLREEKNYLAARVRERVTRIPDSDRG